MRHWDRQELSEQNTKIAGTSSEYLGWHNTKIKVSAQQKNLLEAGRGCTQHWKGMQTSMSSRSVCFTYRDLVSKTENQNNPPPRQGANV